ncbi:hypothetical protein VTO42DRAFT_2087 [Malbranchea cinnamomea]
MAVSRAITDTWTDGEQIRVFESGAVLRYLVDRYDREHKVSYLKDSHAEWILAGYAPKKIVYGINRYSNETRRLYQTMETHLAKSSQDFLCW